MKKLLKTAVQKKRISVQLFFVVTLRMRYLFGFIDSPIQATFVNNYCQRWLVGVKLEVGYSNGERCEKYE